jgi:hypothetical protein
MKVVDLTIRAALKEFNGRFEAVGLKPVFTEEMLRAAVDSVFEGDYDIIVLDDYNKSIYLKCIENEKNGFYFYPIFAGWIHTDENGWDEYSSLMAALPDPDDPAHITIRIYPMFDRFVKETKSVRKTGQDRKGLADI